MSYDERVKRDGPLFLWSLEASSGTTADDATGNSNNGTWSAEPNWGVTGAFNNAVEVASGQYVQSSAGPSSVSDFVMEAWVKSSDGAWPSTRATIASVSDASTSGEYLDLAVDSGNLVHSRGASTTGDSLSIDLSNYDAALWHHVALRQRRVDSTTVEVEVWFDGQQVASASGDWADAAPPWEFGGVGGGGSPWNRQLDELAVFTYDLTDQQIRRHYWAGKGYTGYPLEVLASDPAGYWKLDEGSGTTSADELGINDGTYKGGYTLARSPLIRNGDSVEFNGSDAFVEVPGDDFAFKSGDNFTLEAWFQTSESSQFGTIFHYRNDTGGLGYLMGIKDTGVIELFMQDSSGTQANQSTTSTWNDGSPHYVVGVVDRSSGFAEIWVDAQKQLSFDISSIGNLETTGPMEIGASDVDTSSWDYFNGLLDEPAIYKRALTGQEIKRHYELGLAENSYRIEALSSLPAGLWSFGESSGASTAIDETGNNNDGTYYSATLGQAGLIAEDGTSVEFADSSDNRVEVPGILDPVTTGDWAIEAWIIHENAPGSSDKDMIFARATATQSGSIHLQSSPGEVAFFWYDDTGTNNAGAARSSNGLSAGTVYHVIAQRNGGQNELWIDSELEDTVAIDNNGTLGTTSQPEAFGQDPTNLDDAFDGRIQWGAIYKRSLSQAEIIRHYYVGKFGPVIGTILFIAGVVTDESDGSALDATVRAYRWSDGKLLQSTTSDASTGEYRIEEIEDTDLLVVMQPPSGLRPLAHGPLKPAEG